ncbi:hypothetical protein IHV25_00525 [Phaeovibrio sulfidiphilus]|uniref:Cysteine-rich small domain-containing protein n=1 Tax=Phaeovibrio sulfidiphilus TaxID=1220600 RepID=A0A8J6YKE2_9PROT|nr:cysteine-rich small domain-containing protein [Phaeovibrio sulfidiphilus]MBE1236145.1 hypothetical protein [Phaeovibrio sulfidiphilus]
MNTESTLPANGFKGMTNERCPYLPCHPGVRREFNCLFCYCPLYAYQCIGPYKIFIDKHGTARKDCSACTLPHDGYEGSWKFIQHGMQKLVLWDGKPSRAEQRKAAAREGLPENDTASGSPESDAASGSTGDTPPKPLLS